MAPNNASEDAASEKQPMAQTNRKRPTEDSNIPASKRGRTGLDGQEDETQQNETSAKEEQQQPHGQSRKTTRAKEDPEKEDSVNEKAKRTC